LLRGAGVIAPARTVLRTVLRNEFRTIAGAFDPAAQLRLGYPFLIIAPQRGYRFKPDGSSVFNVP
jgi:hypothetical protein